MGIIDIDEDEDEEFEEERSIDREYPRLLIPPTHYRTPISETRQPTSHRTSSHSRSPTDHESQRIIELERRVRVAEKKAEAERRNRERTEREVRDLQSSLYAPMSDGGRKRKERSGDDDDDLDECLLQYAIKKSRGNDDENFNDSILQYAIEKSRDGTSSKILGSNFPGWLADSSEDLLEPIREAQRAILRRSSSRPVASPRRALGPQTRSDVSTFALNFRHRESFATPQSILLTGSITTCRQLHFHPTEKVYRHCAEP
jgi:hypothetical protein